MMRQLILLGKITLLLLVPLFVFPQCKVSHLNGTMNVNGTDVTVSSSGSVDTISYCGGKLGPYWPGVHSAPPFSCNGGRYSFNFSPPVNEVYLNFGSINGSTADSEIVRVLVNGLHYPLIQVGDTLGCQQLAMLTPDGDITSPNWMISGWEGTKITGVISSLSIQDSVFWGCPNGAVFSLSLCNWVVATDDIKMKENELRVYPNPTSGDFNVLVTEMLINGALRVMNITGETILRQEGLNGGIFLFDISGQPDGVYFIEVKSDKGIKRRKLVKQ